MLHSLVFYPNIATFDEVRKSSDIAILFVQHNPRFCGIAPLNAFHNDRSIGVVTKASETRQE